VVWQPSPGLAPAVAQAVAFAATVPLMPAGATPRIARAALAVTLIPFLWNVAPCRSCVGAPIAAAIYGAMLGAMFGLSATVVAGAVSTAGDLIDVALGSPPFVERAASGGPIARVYQLAFALIFLRSGGLTMMIAEFVHASAALQHPLLTLPGLAALGRASLGTSLLIAGPSLFAQALATLIAGILSRVAPQIGGVLFSAPLISGSVLLAVTVGTFVLRSELVDVVRNTIALPAGFAR
jgi:flagellar biosynthesis protein FliR